MYHYFRFDQMSEYPVEIKCSCGMQELKFNSPAISNVTIPQIYVGEYGNEERICLAEKFDEFLR